MYLYIASATHTLNNASDYRANGLPDYMAIELTD